MRSALPLFLILSLAGCKDPRSVLDKAIQSKNFIPYQLPMPSTRVGTILRGNDKEMYLVARPERCFPDFPDERSLRWTQPTDLPKEYKQVKFEFNSSANAILKAGSAGITFKSSATFVKTVELEFNGASVEFLDEWNFRDYYANGMPGECKRVLGQHPFIGQGLRIESMKFVFKDAADGKIDLNAKINEIVDFSAGMSWHIENSYTLVIDTPKYIGYRMAKIEEGEGAFDIQYATTTEKNGAWIFRTIGAFMMNKDSSPAELNSSGQ